MSGAVLIVCDASPLIFLAKMDRLDLIFSLLGTDVVVLKCVADEVTIPAESASEEQFRLQQFMARVRVIDFTESDPAPSALSRSDRQSLTWAVRNYATWLLADEKLLRNTARGRGLATVGTLGLLVAAVKRGILNPTDAAQDLKGAVERHGFHISAALYQEAVREMRRD